MSVRRGLIFAVVLGLVTSACVLTNASAGHDPGTSLASCRPGSKPAVIGGKSQCLKAGQRCKLRYQRAYRKYGFQCVAGRLQKSKEQAGGPSFQTGHYKGETSRSESIEFWVYQGIQGLRTSEIALECTPPLQLSFTYALDLGFFDVTPIFGDGSFTYDQHFESTITFEDGSSGPTQNRERFTGHLSGAKARGNISLGVTFDYMGTSTDCESGLLTWTAVHVDD